MSTEGLSRNDLMNALENCHGNQLSQHMENKNFTSHPELYQVAREVFLRYQGSLDHALNAYLNAYTVLTSEKVSSLPHFYQIFENSKLKKTVAKCEEVLLKEDNFKTLPFYKDVSTDMNFLNDAVSRASEPLKSVLSKDLTEMKKCLLKDDNQSFYAGYNKFFDDYIKYDTSGLLKSRKDVEDFVNTGNYAGYDVDNDVVGFEEVNLNVDDDVGEFEKLNIVSPEADPQALAFFPPKRENPQDLASFRAVQDLFGGKEEYNKLPFLEIGDRQGNTGYIDFIDINEMKAPIMRGKDANNRDFFAIRATNTKTGDKTCVVFFARGGGDGQWASARGSGFESGRRRQYLHLELNDGTALDYNLGINAGIANEDKYNLFKQFITKRGMDNWVIE